MKNKLTFIEAISVLAIITIAQIVLDFPEILVQLTGTGTIANFIFLSTLVGIFCYIISNIFKYFANQDIIDISEYIGGKALKTIVSIITIIFLFLTSASASASFLYLIKNIFLENNEFLVIISIFLISIFISIIKGFDSTKKVSTFFFGLLSISIILLLFGDNGNFNTNNLIPIFGYNYKTTFFTGFQNIFIFNFSIFFFFLMPLLSKKNEYKKIVFTSFAINIFFIIISIIAILQYYPASITSKITQLSSSNIIVAITRRISISSFLSQTDSIFFLFWGYSILCYVSILLNGIIFILDKNFKYENKQTLSFSVIPIFLGITILINNISKLYLFENIIFKYYSVILLFGIFSPIIIFGYFKKRKELKCKK